MKIWACLALLASSVASTAQAAESVFAPPLDQPLRYEVSQVRTSKGQTQRFSSKDQLRFTRAGTGYHLVWRSGPVEVEAPKPLDVVLREIMKVAAAQPITFVVGGSGEIEGVVDLPAWRRMRSTMLSALLEPISALPVGDVGTKILQGVKDTQDKQTDDQITQEMVETPSYVTAGAVVALDIGEEYSSGVDLPLSVGNGMIKAKMTIKRAENNADGHAHLIILSSPEPGELARAVQGLFETMLADAPTQVRDAALKQISGAHLKLEERLDVDYDQRTGLAVLAVSTKTISFGEAADRVHRTEVKLIR